MDIPKGGRAYTLAIYGMRWVGGLLTVYMALLGWSVAVKGNPLTQDLLAPITFGVLAIATLAGAQVAPNVAERWAGKQLPEDK